MKFGAAIALVIFGASLGWLITQPDWEPLITALGSFGTAIAFTYVDLRRDANFQWFQSRKQYLEHVLKQVQAAERQILMCVHTLTPPNTNSRIAELHRLLQAKKAEGIDVRILAPTGENCVEASYALKIAGIKVRHIHALEDRDISFSVFDSIRSVVPTKSGNQEETVAGFTVHSVKLAKLLKDDFSNMWWSHDALPYESFVRHTVASVDYDPNSETLAVLGDRLRIPISEIERVVPAYGSHDPRRHFFVIGMPASGKTTVAASVHRYLRAKGIEATKIFQFNDYASLYERSLEDHHAFEPGTRGGFRVKDFTVLDTVLEQANLQLRIAQQSHLAFVVEFSRSSYLGAFRTFDHKIMRESVIIYVRCSENTCRQRNEMRTEVNSNHTTGFVPSEILDGYYKTDDYVELSMLGRFLGSRIIEIDTETTELRDLDEEVRRKLDSIESTFGKMAKSEA